MLRYGLIGLFGNRGNGKTTYMVRYLLHQALIGKWYRHVYSNIHIGNSQRIGFVTLDSLEKMHHDSPAGVPSALVGLDQVHKYVDSRRAMSKLNKRVADVIIESRQHGFDVIYTTWARSSVDPRLRRFTELVIDCNRIKGGFRYDLYDAERGILPSQVMTYKQAAAVWRYFDMNELVVAPEILTK